MLTPIITFALGWLVLATVLGILVGKFIHAGQCEALDVRTWLPPEPGPTVAEVLATRPASYNCTTTEAIDLLQRTRFVPVDVNPRADADALAALLADPRCIANLPLLERVQ